MTDEIRDFGMALYEPKQGHGQVVEAWSHEIRPKLELGQALWVSVQPLEEARTLRQNKFYWAAVLRLISEQAQIDGIGATPDGWHVFYKKELLGYHFVKVKEPGRKRKTVRRELRSTTGLSVKQFADYIDQVQAHAATTFGVEFTDRLPADLRPEPRKPKAKPTKPAKPATVIDMDTGEILEGAPA